MTENIDNLLDDLDALITNKPPHGNTDNCSGGSYPYKTPRPPNDKSPSQLYNHSNPKNKFVSSYDNSHDHSNGTVRSENVQNQNISALSAHKKDTESIDSLLELLQDSPVERTPSTASNSAHRNNNTTNSFSQPFSSMCTSSQGTRGGGSDWSAKGSSTSFPHFHSHEDKDHQNLSKRRDTHDSGADDMNSFDSLLSDINKSLPPVSPNTNNSEIVTSSSASVSLLHPPPQFTNVGTKGSRCSRVVIAGSSVPRGSKTSAFTKSACDRLRCLKCNFEALQFSGHMWSNEVDYMFFRNNMPNRQKLSPKLLDKPSSVAYCCQCSWISTEEEETLSPGQLNKPQWVCAGH